MKKILAVVFILVGSFLAVFVVAQVMMIVSSVSMVLSADAGQVTYFVLSVGLTLFSVALGYILFRYAFKWLRKAKPSSSEVLDDHLNQNNVGS